MTMHRHPLVGLAVIAAALAVVAAAPAQGVSSETLRSAGWTCFVPPPFPNMLVCGNPAHGLPPVPADPNGP
jgi:hypothetical protein